MGKLLVTHDLIDALEFSSPTLSPAILSFWVPATLDNVLHSTHLGNLLLQKSSALLWSSLTSCLYSRVRPKYFRIVGHSAYVTLNFAGKS